jgi:hypothetical protein
MATTTKFTSSAIKNVLRKSDVIMTLKRQLFNNVGGDLVASCGSAAELTTASDLSEVITKDLLLEIHGHETQPRYLRGIMLKERDLPLT